MFRFSTDKICASPLTDQCLWWYLRSLIDGSPNFPLLGLFIYLNTIIITLRGVIGGSWAWCSKINPFLTIPRPSGRVSYFNRYQISTITLYVYYEHTSVCMPMYIAVWMYFIYKDICTCINIVNCTMII